MECSWRRLRLPGLCCLAAALAPVCAAFCVAPFDDPLKPRWGGGGGVQGGQSQLLLPENWSFRSDSQDTLRYLTPAFQTLCVSKLPGDLLKQLLGPTLQRVLFKGMRCGTERPQMTSSQVLLAVTGPL